MISTQWRLGVNNRRTALSLGTVSSFLNPNRALPNLNGKSCKQIMSAHPSL